MNRIKIALLVIILSMTPLLVSAETLTHEEGEIEIWVPDDWDYAAEDNYLTMSDEDVEITFSLLEYGELSDALDDLAEETAVFFDEISYDETEVIEINGMEAILITGIGSRGSFDFEFACVLLDTPSGDILMVVGYADAEWYEYHLETIMDVFNSIAPLED